ncbi:LLM class flavin-dependent oxidoreductase [Streptomyces sp. NPDC004539]|uniref:LLM class flavin-dependent oxidoreductase n=1 Tax=Streptomyces sp. NPDC004539 TaxID=3154280 RepID=UPI0033B54738
MTDRHPGLHLALETEDAHPATGTPLTPKSLHETARAAEQAGFALLTYADTPTATARVEAGTRAAYVSTRTDRVGLAPTLHVTTTEPFHLATQLAALDHASHGRAAWLVGAASDADSLATVGRGPLPADALHREITDVVDTARALWDSWEDDAIVKDVATGRFLDADRVHHIDFEGATFTVKGPLITPRPPQGQIVVLAPDALEIDGRADVVLVSRPTLAEVTSRARESAAPLVFAEVEVVLDTDVPAVERLARLDGVTPWPESGRLRHVGSARALAGLLTELAGSVDGVRLHPAVLADDLPVLTGQVLPALAAAGLHHPPRSGDTLRTTLGLPRPASRFATTEA